MSHAATKWAFDQPELHRDMKPSEWAVLMVLADCHNPVNGCFPSQDYICSKTNLAERAVRDQLARLRERGLIDWDAMREGQRRGSNRYRLGFEADFQPANSAGREDAASTGENEHSQPAESDTLNRQNLPPNLVREPVKEPIERERGREDGQEDPKRIEARGWALLKDWPGFAGMPKEPAMKVWMSLSADDRDKAERRFPGWLALLKAQKKSHTPAPSTYFGQKLFDEVEDPREPAKPLFVLAKPFGPLWQAARLKLLLDPPTEQPLPSGFLRDLLMRQDERGEAARRERRMKLGWPAVNAMHDKASQRQGVTVETALEPLAETMEAVPVNSQGFENWRLEHERRAWPWIPDPGSQPVVYFPAGGPGALSDFEAAVRGTRDDAGGREAAE